MVLAGEAVHLADSLGKVGMPGPFGLLGEEFGVVRPFRVDPATPEHGLGQMLGRVGGLGYETVGGIVRAPPVALPTGRRGFDGSPSGRGLNRFRARSAGP